MAKVRCKRTNVDSFFGNFVYDQKVSRNHLLRKLEDTVGVSKRGILLYLNQAESRLIDKPTFFYHTCYHPTLRITHPVCQPDQ